MAPLSNPVELHHDSSKKHPRLARRRPDRQHGIEQQCVRRRAFDLRGAISDAGEGKCGEGKCGGSGKASQSEGKCGEGKCGAGAKAGAEGKCGEGKCGDASFAKTDSNHDGKVSRDEFLAVAKDRARDFDTIDRNHDGFISEQEAADHLKAIYQANGKAMPDGLFSHLTGKP